MKKLIYIVISSIFCTSVFADAPPICPSAADIQKAKFVSMPVYNISLFTSVDNGFVIANGPTQLAAQMLVANATAPYTLTAQSIPIDTKNNIYYCAYAPGSNIQPSQYSMGIYWISANLSPSKTLELLKK